MPRQLIAAALVLIAGAAGAVAQVDPAAPDDSKQANQGVYVRDSAVAAEKMALGERMERLKEWGKAADVFQEILEKYSDRVVQSTVPGQANHYSSVIVAVQQRLAKWPEDGLRAYRNRYESPAADLLSAAGRDDYGALNTVYQRYFITDAGKSAGLRLIDLYLEDGEFSAAAWLGDRLLQWHPTIAPEKAGVLYRVAVAYHLSGDQDKAKARLEELKTSSPGSTGTVRGQDVNLVDSLAKDLAAPIAGAQNTSADSWPVLMGDAARSRISTGAGRAGARPFSSIDLARPNYVGLTPEARQDYDGAEKLDKEQGLNIGIIPAVDRGEMFFQDGARIYAVSLDSGTPLPGWAQTYAGTGEFISNAAVGPVSHRQQYTVTVTDKEVLAVVGHGDRTIQFPGQPPTASGETRLVCLDRTSGKEKWSCTPRDFPDQGNVRSLSLGGSPLVVGNNVYICGTGGKSPQFDDCYVFCLDRESGKHKWSAYVCSASTGQVIMGGDTGPVSNTIASAAYSSGRLYVLSNLGAVAALDAYSGAVAWLDTYERDAVDDPRMMRFGMAGTSQLTRPWSCNPAVVDNGHVFALPTDGKYLAVYDAGSGESLKRISLADVDNANTLIGIKGNKLIVSSDTRVFAFNWEAYDPARFNPRSGVIYWGSTFSKTPIRGRGFVTADSVFIPTRERLFRIGMASGKIEESYPPFPRGPWEEPEGPGNVIVTEDKVIIAGPARVNVYTDMAVARARLDKDVAAAPADADLRLRYADMLFAAGDIPASLGKLDEAIKLLGGPSNLAPGLSRDRAFHSALTFAQKLSDPKVYSADNRDVVNGLFDRAASAALSDSQQVEYRVVRARFAHANSDFPVEMRLYQEILANDAMRAVPLGTPDGASFQQAAGVAEAAIDAIIKQPGGAQLYASYEQAAKTAMDNARAAGKPGDLLQIAQHFPNASVASESMFFAAEAYESTGDNRRATQVLRQIYFKYPQSNKIAVLEAMARNYLAIPGRSDVAAARLAQAAHLAGSAKLSKPLKLPNGSVLENVTFAQAAGALQQLQSDAVARALPKFGLPGETRAKPLSQRNPISNIAALVLPLHEFGRLDRVVTFSADNQIGCYAPGSPQPLWLNKSLADAPRECAWIGTNQLAVWNSSEIALLSAENGTTVWRFAIKSLPEVQVVAGDQSVAAAVEAPNPAEQAGGGWVFINGQRVRIVQGGRFVINNNRLLVQRGFGARVVNAANPPAGMEQIVQVRPAGDKLIGSTTTGRLFAVDLAAGHLAWQARLTTDHPIERLLATDDFAVARFSDGAVTQIIAVDAATGQTIRRYDTFRVDNNTVPINETLSPDGTLVIALADRLLAKDLYEPGAANKWETVRQNNADSIYVGSEFPDQLLAQDGRVIIVSDTGSFIRVLSLDTGMPVTAKGDTGPANVRFATGSRPNTAVHLRLAGTHLYAFGPQTLRAFDLDHPLASAGERVVFEDTNLRDLFVGSDFVVALDDPGVARFIGNPDAPSNKARLLAYSRATVNGQESGVLIHDPVFPEPKGITTWQPVNGGFFYLTSDQQLHFLKANTP